MTANCNAVTKSVCGGCGFPVQARRRDARTCSNACRQKAYRARRSELVRPLQIALLLDRIERNDRIAWENTVPYAIRVVPGLVICRAYGPGFPALGRRAKDKRHLRRLLAEASGP